jgi:peptidyl-prolyl cis-trans isomerase C
MASSASANPDPTVAATVNGEVIRLAEVDAVIRREIRPSTPLTDDQTRQLRQNVLEDLIDDLLIKQFLREHGPAVTSADVDHHLRALSASLRRQHRSLEQYCQETGQTMAQLRDTWSHLLRLQKYVDQRATESELRKYHEKYRELFDRTVVKVNLILMRVPTGSPPGDWQTAREKLQEIKREILAGRLNFEDAARKYSVDPSAAQGGQLGWIARRDSLVDDALAEAAFAMKIGEISDPIEVEHGIGILQVAARKPGTPRSFESVVDLVRECYIEDIRRELVRQMRRQSVIHTVLP